MAGSINLAEYVARITLDQSNLSEGLDEADKKIKTSLENISEKTGQAFKNIGGKVESAGKSFSKISVPLAGIGIAALKVGSDFQAGMSQVQAISGATGEDLDRLTEKAKEMGASTKFSATESAEALMYMSMAGWDTNQMLDALEGVMMLAASSGEDLALVSDIVTDSMTAFGLEASEASNFADLLASASSNSNTNVGMLGESFKYVAPLFGSLGYSAEDAALGLGLMANAGIKGGQAGTALRSAISNLVNPTDKTAIAMERLGLTITDANGEMLPFQDIMIQLREKFADLSEEQQAQYAATIFGQQAMSGMLAIINAGEEDFNNLTDATRNYSGVAKEMADVMEDNLQGQITVLKSQLEGLGIQIFDILVPIFSNLVEKLQGLAEWFSNLSPRTQEIIVKIGLLTACIAPALVIIGKLIAIVGSAITTFGTIATAVAGAGGAIGLLASPIGIAIAAIGAIIAIGVTLYKNWDTIKEKAGQLKDKISETWDNMKTKISDTWDNIKTNTSKTWDNIKDNTSKTWEFMKKKVDEHGGGIKGVIGIYMEGYKKVWTEGFNQMDRLTGGKLSDMLNKVKDKTNNIKNTISQNISSAANSWNTNVSNMLSNAQSKFSSMANAVSNTFSKVTSAISKGINSLLDWNRQRVENKQATFTTKIKEITEKVTNFVTGKTPSYNVGTPFVPTDQLAFLHKGEAVIPAKYNPFTTNNNLGGNVINIGGSQIKLEVQGNLDSDILPDVKKMIDNSIKQAQDRQVIELNKSGIFRKVAVI